MFGRAPYERARFARSTRSFIILTNGAHSSESFVTWPTNFGEFDPDGANLQSSCAARKPRPFIISGSDRRKPEVNRSYWKRKRQPSSFASSRIHDAQGARALPRVLLARSLPGCLAASVALGSARSGFEATPVVDADDGVSESRSRRRRGRCCGLWEKHKANGVAP